MTHGVEAVEIDVRLASTLNSNFFGTGSPYGHLLDSNGGLVLSHDECIDRITTGSGALRGTTNTKSKCLVKSGFSLAQFQALQLRDRNGNTTYPGTTQSYQPPPTLAQAFQLLKSYLSVDSNGVLRGPVMIVDLKDKDDPGPPDGQPCIQCMTFNEYIYGLSIMKANLPQAMWPAVLWKMKMASALPSPVAIQTQMFSQLPGPGADSYGHVVLTINPEDAGNQATDEPDDGGEFQQGETVAAQYGPLGTSFLTLLGYATVSFNQAVPYVAQFEWVPYSPKDGSNIYLTQAPSGGKPMNSFATYYEPNFYPEGFANRFGTCCVIAAPNSAEATTTGPLSVDNRGTLDFASYFSNFPSGFTPLPQISTITSDNLIETLNYLVAAGARTTSEIQ